MLLKTKLKILNKIPRLSKSKLELDSIHFYLSPLFLSSLNRGLVDTSLVGTQTTVRSN